MALDIWPDSDSQIGYPSIPSFSDWNQISWKGWRLGIAVDFDFRLCPCICMSSVNISQKGFKLLGSSNLVDVMGSRRMLLA